jgi:glycerol-3-phosphate dehydrogenase
MDATYSRMGMAGNGPLQGATSIVLCMTNRAAALRDLGAKPFDALIIGGGITGCGAARDATLRGLQVALVDKGDFASGTSSRSSRLVHGGVRYLEHGHLHLVFEASAERRALLKLAPHLVEPLPFVWPVYAGQRLPLWKIAAGLTLYDVLSLFRNVERHHRLSARSVRELEPRLNDAGLRGGVRYFDAATDDARLTLANALDAAARGATVANHVKFTGVGPSRDGYRVARLEDALTGETIDARARVFLNATGPWSDSVRSLAGEHVPAAVQGSKGSHIAVPRDRVGNNEAITLTHPSDGRVLFVLPAGRHAIVGTTDTFTHESPDEVRATEGDVRYLLDAVNSMFPGARLVREDVVSAWSGIRPLLPSKASSVQATREHTISVGDGSVTITGGKLTTYRVMARQGVDAVEKLLGRPRASRHVSDVPFPASGTEPAAGDVVEPGLPYRMSDMTRGVERELACTLGDLLVRRTKVAFETRDNGRAAARRVAAHLGWGEKEIARYDAEVARIFTVER